MYYKTSSKKELKSTFSRSIKKRNIDQIYLTNFYLTLVKYNFLKYFFRNQLIYLNYKVLTELSKEEVATTSILKNWILFHLKKIIS